MAKLLPALEATLKKEGFYSNDPQDAGGETIWGIARNMHKEWRGWEIVDEFRRATGFPVILKENKELLALRDSFYEHEFWEKIKGAYIINQEAANDLFDKAVNMGVKQSVILCQRSLGITESGVMNDGTLNQLNEANPYA